MEADGNLTEDVVHSREETSLVMLVCNNKNTLEGTDLKPAHQETIRSQLCKGVCTVLHQCEDSPHNVHEGNHPGHWESGEEEYKGKLSNHCSHRIHGLQLDKLVAMKAQIIFQP